MKTGSGITGKALGLLLPLLLLIGIAAPAWAWESGQTHYYLAFELTEGEDSLDAISGVSIGPNDLCLTWTGGSTVYVHSVDVDSGATEHNPPLAVTPEDLQAGGTGSGVTTWRLTGLSGATVHAHSAFFVDASRWDDGSGGMSESVVQSAVSPTVFDKATDELGQVISGTSSQFIVHNGTAWIADSDGSLRDALGLAIGSDVQAWDADLDDLADGTLSKSKVQDSGNWDTAYGWGDHSGQNYFDTDVDDLDAVPEGTAYKRLTATKDGYIDQDVTSGASPTFTVDNFSDGGSNAIITTTQETNFEAAHTHISSSGSDHGYVDQDVTSGASPTFTADNFSDGGGNAIITTTQETNFESAYTHVSSSGTDHGYVDQDVTSGASPTFVTAKLSDLTDGYVPYHVSDAAGLADSPIYTDGTDVGIGTSSPSSKLDVDGTTTTRRQSAFTTDTTAGNYVDSLNLIGSRETAGDETLGGSIGFSKSDADGRRASIVAVQTNGDADVVGLAFYGHGPTATDPLEEYMRIEGETGKVGIGTTGPVGKLEVSGGMLYTRAASGALVDAEQIRIGRSDSNVRYHSIHSYHSGSAAENYLQFKLHDGSGDPYTAQTTVLTLNGAGNVGIGTTGPDEALDVDGNIQAAGYGSFESGVSLLNSEGIEWQSGASVFESGGDVYASNSTGTDTKLTTHDLEGRAVHLSYNRYLDTVKLLEIERFMLDYARGVKNGPYVHTDWSAVTILTGVAKPPERDFWAEQQAEQWAAFAEEYVSGTTIPVSESAAFETVTRIEREQARKETIIEEFDPESGETEFETTETPVYITSSVYQISDGKVVEAEKREPVYAARTVEQVRLKEGHALDPETGVLYRRPTLAEARERFTFDPGKVRIPPQLEGRIEPYYD